MIMAQSRSSFCGTIDEIPCISVDNFERTGYKAYFLSHCHTDHTHGLFCDALLDYLSKNKVYIYTSKLSAAIVAHESENRTTRRIGQRESIADYVIPLDIGEPTTITISGEDDSEDQYITVTLLPAGHCVGSVMFLFKTLYKTILYTGDFRISVNSVSKYALLHENGDTIKLDALYVDTTFQNDRHDDFPKRSDSVEVVIRHIKKWLSLKDTNQIALHTSAKYGYEFVYNDIFSRLKEKVYVGNDLWPLYCKFPKLVPGATSDPNSRIHKCRNKFRSSDHNLCSPKFQSTNPEDFLLIHFSAYKWSNYKQDGELIEIQKDGRIDVCFATHCSRDELEYFVNYLRPIKIVGFPNNYRTEERTSSKRPALNHPKSSPPAKAVKILDRSTVRKIFSDL